MKGGRVGIVLLQCSGGGFLAAGFAKRLWGDMYFNRTK